MTFCAIDRQSVYNPGPQTNIRAHGYLRGPKHEIEAISINYKVRH